MIRVDLNHHPASLPQHDLPGTGRLELYWDTQKCAGVTEDPGVWVERCHRLNLLPIRGQQNDRAEITGGTRNVLGDDRQQRVHVWNCLAEGIRCSRDCGDSSLGGARSGVASRPWGVVAHGATLC